jgi:hypothetical protein
MNNFKTELIKIQLKMEEKKKNIEEAYNSKDVGQILVAEFDLNTILFEQNKVLISEMIKKEEEKENLSWWQRIFK